MLLGDAVDRYGGEIAGLRTAGVEYAPEDIRYQDAVSVAKLGVRIYEEGGGVSCEMLLPDYMRLAEAERKLRQQRKG